MAPAVSAVFLRHIPHESGGRFERDARAAGWQVALVDPAAPGARGQALAADLLVVLGGPMGVYEAERYPFLTMEIEVLRERLTRRAPVVGVCLGAQLLAAAAGARVYKGSAGFEVGFGELRRAPGAEAHPLGRALPAQFPVLHWHGDTFDLPAGATLLASSERYANQVFAVGAHALGLQCHIEVTAGELPVFAGGNTGDLAGAGRPSFDAVLGDGRACDALVEGVYAELWGAFRRQNGLTSPAP